MEKIIELFPNMNKVTVRIPGDGGGCEVQHLKIDRVEADGIAVGTAAVFDRTGTLGTVVTTSLANAKRTVDLGRTSYDDDGTRRDVKPGE